MRLTDSTFLLYAAKHYDDRMASDSDEFYEDLKRFQYLRRLFRRNEEEGELKVRLILNHVIVLFNCFGPAAAHMLFFKLREFHPQLKPFVTMLNYMPARIEYEDVSILESDVPLDPLIVDELRRL